MTSKLSYTGCYIMIAPPLHSKVEWPKISKNYIYVITIESIFLCRKLEHHLYWLTSGGLICKGWSNLLSRSFLTVFSNGH